MKLTKFFVTPLVIAGVAVGVMLAHGAEGTPKPYPLAKCIVSDEAFEGSDMTPFSFVHEGQTIKLCCKGCLKDFKKDPAKYMRKLDEATKK